MDNTYRRLLEFTRDGVYRYSWEDGRILLANKGFVRIMGLEGGPEVVVGRRLRELMIYTEREGSVRKALEDHGEIHGFEYHFKTLGGEDRWVLHDSFVTTDPTTGERVVEAIVKDITERKLGEMAIAAERERLLVTLRSIGDGVITTDREGRVVLVNRVAEHLTGWTQAEAAGHPLSDVFHIINERTRKPCENPVDKVLETGGIIGLANHTALIARDGAERVIADSGAPIRDGESRIVGVVLVFRDQTEQRRLEEEAQKVQRLESLGILAGGIAHDFNNLLTGISGNVSLARVTLPPSEPAVARLVEAEKAVVRARDLTQQLLTFSKGGAPVRKTASIGEVILDSVGFALTGSAARCEVSVPDDLWAVAVDEGQINQVLHNLILNADQAMPMGGVIRVKAENVDVGERHPYPVAPGRHVRITVEDTGTGIHPEHLPRIFDPYFTTKQKGSGLGLSISYSIIRRHSGYIFVKSELGAGTTFYLYLPASRPEAPRVPKTEPAIPRGEGRVLVMDDEDIVASVAKAMLEHLGYQVEVTRDGAEAIEAWRRAHHGGKPFDALLMDLTVAGGMGGLEAVRRIRDEDPGVRAIVSSGYSSDPVMSQHERYGFCGVATKPYRIDELALVVSAACRPASDATPDSDP